MHHRAQVRSPLGLHQQGDLSSTERSVQWRRFAATPYNHTRRCSCTRCPVRAVLCRVPCCLASGQIRLAEEKRSPLNTAAPRFRLQVGPPRSRERVLTAALWRQRPLPWTRCDTGMAVSPLHAGREQTARKRRQTRPTTSSLSACACVLRNRVARHLGRVATSRCV